MLFGVPKRNKQTVHADENKVHFSYWFAEKVVKYKYLTIIATTVIIIISISGTEKVWINSSFLDKFEKDSEIVLTDAFINEHFGGTSTALISSIAIGIGIDYAVHFIERYKIYALETGDKALTIRRTMHHSGRAILFNAMVVIAGFLVLLLSVFPPNRTLGALVSLNMFTSFLGTVTIMFILLYRTNVYFNKTEQDRKEVRHDG